MEVLVAVGVAVGVTFFVGVTVAVRSNRDMVGIFRWVAAGVAETFRSAVIVATGVIAFAGGVVTVTAAVRVTVAVAVGSRSSGDVHPAAINISKAMPARLSPRRFRNNLRILVQHDFTATQVRVQALGRVKKSCFYVCHEV